MRTAGLAATVMLVGTGLCAPAAVADKGGEPHDGSHGQEKQEQSAERSPAWGAGDGAEHQQQKAEAPRREGPAKRKKCKKGQGQAGSGDAGQAEVKPAEAKPVEAKPVEAKPAPQHSEPSRKAPKRHGHAKKERRPAPAEAPKVTPVAAAPAQAPALAPSQAAHKTTICHRTGSQSNPWVTITVANPALKAHRRHGDLIPAPAGGCPQAAAAPAHEEPEAGGPPPIIVTNPDSPGGSPGSSPADSPTAVATPSGSPSAPGAVLADSTQGTGPVPTTVTSATARGRVLAARVSAPRAAAPTAAAAARTASSGSRMPYTGLMAWLVAVAGAGALLAGVALRRAHGMRHR